MSVFVAEPLGNYYYMPGGMGTNWFTENFGCELSLSYNFAPGDRWIKQKGSAPQPPDTNLDTTDIVIVIRFGS